MIAEEMRKIVKRIKLMWVGGGKVEFFLRVAMAFVHDLVKQTTERATIRNFKYLQFAFSLRSVRETLYSKLQFLRTFIRTWKSNFINRFLETLTRA